MCQILYISAWAPTCDLNVGPIKWTLVHTIYKIEAYPGAYLPIVILAHQYVRLFYVNLGSWSTWRSWNKPRCDFAHFLLPLRADKIRLHRFQATSPCMFLPHSSENGTEQRPVLVHACISSKEGDCPTQVLPSTTGLDKIFAPHKSSDSISVEFCNFIRLYRKIYYISSDFRCTWLATTT